MKITIVIVTQSEATNKTAGLHKESLIPADIRKKISESGSSIKLRSFFFAGKSAPDKLASFISDICDEEDALISLWEEGILHEAENYNQSMFNCTFDANLGGKTAKNYFTMTIAKAFKEFSHFSRTFDDMKFRKCLLLPIHSFKANEMDELVTLFNPIRRPGNFADALTACLTRLRERQTPKRYSSYGTTYLRDDSALFFEYGHEVHSRVETKRPPHRVSCLINSLFRFGRSYEPGRHFNVSYEKNEKVEKVFKNCHETEKPGVGNPHINMFPNGCF
jgi:hypothetical protein